MDLVDSYGASLEANSCSGTSRRTASIGLLPIGIDGLLRSIQHTSSEAALKDRELRVAPKLSLLLKYALPTFIWCRLRVYSSGAGKSDMER